MTDGVGNKGNIDLFSIGLVYIRRDARACAPTSGLYAASAASRAAARAATAAKGQGMIDRHAA